ncbi:hypothetical protein [Blastococcus sp. LR1]|uniref:Rv0361 family membrane protein n=1 Tax=Blastococcus sp. LR1 TaxID=2877000 RepID=UPI001CC9F167|nr:hypothetical protein [Blastococcus sp. LR1]MCA0144093.1 hypothetical protein [Blastococcus sp. LR1]
MTTVPPPVGDPQPPTGPAPWISPGASTGPVTGTGSRRWLYVAGAGVAVVGLIIATGGGSDRTPVETAEEHVEAFVSGEWEDAYELLCAEERASYDDAEDYGASMVNSFGGALHGATVTGEVEQDSNGDVEVEVELRSVFGTGDQQLDLVLEDGEYLVCEGLLE